VSTRSTRFPDASKIPAIFDTSPYSKLKNTIAQDAPPFTARRSRAGAVASLQWRQIRLALCIAAQGQALLINPQIKVGPRDLADGHHIGRGAVIRHLGVAVQDFAQFLVGVAHGVIKA